MTTKIKAWISFKEVVTPFLCNARDPNYEFVAANMIHEFKNLDNLIFKVHFLYNQNLGDVSEDPSRHK